MVFLGQMPAEPEINNFDFELFVDEYILKFDIAMDNVVGVEIGDCFDELLVYEFGDVLGNRFEVLCFDVV